MIPRVLSVFGRVHLRAAGIVVAMLAGVTLLFIETPMGAGAYGLPVAVVFGLALVHAGCVPLAVVRPNLAAVLSIGAAATLQALTSGTSSPWPWWVITIVTQTTVFFVVGLLASVPLTLLYWLTAIGASAVLAAVLRPEDAGAPAVNVVIFGGVAGAAIAVAVVLAQWHRIRALLIRERQVSAGEASRRVLMEERARIARELHDVIAHSMSIITVQSTTARFRHPDFGEQAIAEFEQLGELSRQALDEMRGLLGVLRDGDDAAPRTPQPGFTDLPDLMAQAERAGMVVSLQAPQNPDAQMADVTGLAVYRIVQEALSNAIRHAPGAAVQVACIRDGDCVTVDVRNERPATTPAAHAAPSTDIGHGLIGMRERAASVGGSVTAAATADGGFAVHAVLPLHPLTGGPLQDTAARPGALR
ncbi:sensor histidine kinase [uncultured Amnibacterium sp.]|uniref:sensor histidine kinase n=1 Tax=uncultured Amnibacterium sp. TaxID=1631851 RepID=UPI0035CAE1E9